MTKPKTRAPEPEVVAIAETGSIVPEPPAAPHVVIATWADLPNFRCSHCSFATIESEAVVEWHIVEAHLE